MSSLLLIANPASSGFSRQIHRRVISILSRRYDVEAAWPSSADHARELTGKAIADGIEMVAAMGGDGIVHHVAQSVVGTDVPFGVIPSGTANVVARQMKIPVRATAAAKVLIGNHSIVGVPTLEATAQTTTGPLHRHVVFSLGFGADADIVLAAESKPNAKRDFGPLHYVTTAISQVRRDIAHRSPELRVDAEDHSTLAIGVMAQFRESYTYFGRVPMRLGAQPPDPITILIVEQMRVRRAASMIRASTGKRGLEAVRGFDLWSGVRQFSISSAAPTTMQADGEIYKGVTEVDVGHRPDGLRIVVRPPKKAD